MLDSSAADAEPDPARAARQTWPAEARQLSGIRSTVRRWLTSLDVAETISDDLVLAVNEAASNAIDHAYCTRPSNSTVEVAFWTETGALFITVTDRGAWRPPSTAHVTGRGLGILLMRQLVGHVGISRDGEGTRVLLRHPLQLNNDRPVPECAPHEPGRAALTAPVADTDPWWFDRR